MVCGLWLERNAVVCTKPVRDGPQGSEEHKRSDYKRSFISWLQVIIQDAPDCVSCHLGHILCR